MLFIHGLRPAYGSNLQLTIRSRGVVPLDRQQRAQIAHKPHLKTARSALAAAHRSTTTLVQQVPGPEQTVTVSAQGTHRVHWASNTALEHLLPHLHSIFSITAILTHLNSVPETLKTQHLRGTKGGYTCRRAVGRTWARARSSSKRRAVESVQTHLHTQIAICRATAG